MEKIHIGYTGQRQSVVSEVYLLGKGYRGFNPVLKQFTGQDDMSPFGAGGVQGFSYCGENPVNRTDSSGHMFGIPGLFMFLMVGGKDVAEAAVVSDAVVMESADMAVSESECRHLATYENKENTQRPLYSLNSIYQLDKSGDNYRLINMADVNDTRIPDGDYLFTVRTNTFTSGGKEWDPSKFNIQPEHLQDEKDIMRVIREPKDISENPGDRYGHTSMTQIKVPTRSPVVAKVYYAGQLKFSQGNLLSWTNKSGHYRPADAKTSLLPSAVSRLLPLALYTGV